MIKINTDFKALRPDGGETASRAIPVAESPAPASGPVDQAELSQRHQAIIQANRAASQSRVRDLETAQVASRSLREAIAAGRQDSFATHQALSAERVKSLLE